MTTKRTLQLIFGFVFICMLIVTTWASGYENVFIGGKKIIDEPWGLATLFDTYFAFFTFYAWVFYKESSFISRLLWLMAIVVLGNIAISAYVLWQLKKQGPVFSASDFFLKKSDRSALANAPRNT